VYELLKATCHCSKSMWPHLAVWYRYF